MDGPSRNDERDETEDVEIYGDLRPPDTRPYVLPEISATTDSDIETMGVTEPETRPFDPERHRASLETLAMKGGLTLLAALVLFAYTGVIFLDDTETADQLQSLSGLFLPPVVGLIGFAAGRRGGGR